MLYTVFNNVSWKSDTSGENWKNNLDFFGKCSYFNNSIGCWEPLVEQSQFSFSHEGSLAQKDPERITLLAKSSTAGEIDDPVLQFCITENLVRH